MRSTLGPVPPEVAQGLLEQLVVLHRSGLASPLPVPVKTAEAYAAQRARGRRPSSARHVASQQWTGSRLVPGEQSDPEHVLLLGDGADLDRLLVERSTPADLVNGWPGDEEGDRFGVVARRIWEPLLRYEEQETL